MAERVVEKAMFGKNAVPFYLVAGVVVTLAIGSTFTPVISRGASVDRTSKEVEIGNQEYSFCQSEVSDVNCACFAGISGYILSQDVPEFRGSKAIDRSGLARTQAKQSC